MSLRWQADTRLTVAQASAESGMSADHLRHLVKNGRIANAGRHGKPLIRRSDLGGPGSRSPESKRRGDPWDR